MCVSETVLAEMGVALREDSTLVGVFSPRKVEFYYCSYHCCCSVFVVLYVLCYCGDNLVVFFCIRTNFLYILLTCLFLLCIACGLISIVL